MKNKMRERTQSLMATNLREVMEILRILNHNDEKDICCLIGGSFITFKFCLACQFKG